MYTFLLFWTNIESPSFIEMFKFKIIVFKIFLLYFIPTMFWFKYFFKIVPLINKQNIPHTLEKNLLKPYLIQYLSGRYFFTIAFHGITTHTSFPDKWWNPLHYQNGPKTFPLTSSKEITCKNDVWMFLNSFLWRLASFP